MTVNVECSADSANEEARNASAKELIHHIKSVVGVSSRVVVHEPGGVARSEGKAKRVVDNRQKI
jgi:phenylacetate-CoA ligase